MENKEKSRAEILKEELLMNPKNITLLVSDDEIKKADDFCEGYKKFLDFAKTERESVDFAVKEAQIYGFQLYQKGKKYSFGDKVYFVNRNKAVVLAVIGSQPLDGGVNIVAAHIDSPRLDLKPRPLYEEGELTFFKTHYYGGIKKYQWVALPLALHGIIIKKDGTSLQISIGENAGEPQFCITDLLPHLAGEQMKKTLSDGITGEGLNILIGSRPFRDDKAVEKVKLNIIKLLNEKYGIIESDFLSAELELVPAHKAVDIGLDRSMVGAYGHDDRVCAYTALMAALECNNPKTTNITVLTDKEETGSDGNTGLSSAYLRYFIADLAKPNGFEARDVLSKSICLSADVNAAFDPNFSEVNEKRNTAYLNFGVAVTKYTGSRGKSGTSDASAELMGRVRRLLDDGGVIWQTGELGKVDQGGGGTVAKLIANLDVEVVDVGVPVLSMHSPLEVVAKLDVYMAYRAFCEFIK